MAKIAIIGSGISGLSCAYLLGKDHDTHLYEANDYLGGHTATIDVNADDKAYAIDTGFIVFNDRTYPNFIELMRRCGVESQKTEMSFSVYGGRTGLEYNGKSLASLFAQKRNLVNPRFYYFLWEILRFNKLASRARGELDKQLTLGEYLQQQGFSDYFSEHYILPMIAAIWSSSVADAKQFPLAFFVEFFSNHGLLQIKDRPQWYVLKGGSRSYIPALSAHLNEIFLQTPVQRIERLQHSVVIHSSRGKEHYDEVILACHADQALNLLADATADEHRILGDLPYRNNEVILHTDTHLLPTRPKAWASWNYALHGDSNVPPSVTYNMNILQGIEANTTFCVSLNQTANIDPQKVLRRFNYAHPVMNQAAISAQQQRQAICGKSRTHFCGAYWYNGFHEDGVNSALDVCKRFGKSL